MAVFFVGFSVLYSINIGFKKVFIIQYSKDIDFIFNLVLTPWKEYLLQSVGGKYQALP